MGVTTGVAAAARGFVETSARVISHFSCVRLFATPWTIAHQAPLSMGFSRQEYWSGLPCPETSTGKHPGPTPGAHQGLLVQMLISVVCL